MVVVVVVVVVVGFALGPCSCFLGRIGRFWGSILGTPNFQQAQTVAKEECCCHNHTESLLATPASLGQIGGAGGARGVPPPPRDPAPLFRTTCRRR